MSKRILVAYASGSGSTREVAEAIAAEIAKNGISVNVIHVNQVENVTPYSGIILGSSIRIGHWLPEAVACLNRIKKELPRKQVAYFTTCLTMIHDTNESRKTVLNYMQPLFNLAPTVKPIGLGLFAGSLDPDRLAIMARSGPQDDYRNWSAIRAWGQEIHKILLANDSEEQLALAQTILSYTDMSYTDLSRINLQGAALHEAYLVETNLEASHLEWADLSRSQMQGAHLFQANLIGSIMTDSTMKDANLAEAVLNGAILQNANLARVNFTKADMNWVDLTRADLSHANLQQARLGWAKLTDANLLGANLTGARYNKYTIWPQGFSPEEAGCIDMGRESV